MPVASRYWKCLNLLAKVSDENRDGSTGPISEDQIAPVPLFCLRQNDFWVPDPHPTLFPALLIPKIAGALPAIFVSSEHRC